MSFDPRNATVIKALETEFSEPAGCYVNVKKQVQKHGGKPKFGWVKGYIIFDEMPKILTWVHHCVWESPEGQLFEITPFIQKIFGDESFLATFNEESLFIPDDSAQLIKLADGRYRSLAPEYTAVSDSEDVRKGIEYMKSADRKLRAGDLRGEAYWCERAAAVLGGWIAPHGELGLRTMAPFTLDEEDGNADSI